jgi:RHS repeat-associated protein
MGTNKGFTGQYNDSLTGLDYYNARYYDPVVGVFLSADKVQGNPQGANPYAYVGGNPETKNDPTGNKVVCPDSCGGSSGGGTTTTTTGPITTGNGQRLCQLNGGCGQTQSSGAGQHKHLTGDQLSNWCYHDAKCSDALLHYAYAQAVAASNHDAMMMAAFFEFLDGDPEAFQQLTEEEALVFQQLAEEENVTLNDAVSAKLTSSNPSDRVEGEAGAIAALYSKLIRFNQQFGTRGSDGEIDAETPEAIIEAKSGPFAGKLPRLIRQYNNTVTNPDRKPFVIYAPDWNQNMVQTAYQNLGSLDSGQDVYITTSPEQLIEVLVYLQE